MSGFIDGPTTLISIMESNLSNTNIGELKAGVRFEYRGYPYVLSSFLCETQEASTEKLTAEQARGVAEGMTAIHLRFCLPEEATFVMGTGLGDVYAPLGEIELLTPWPNWTEQQITECHKQALQRGTDGQYALTYVCHRAPPSGW